MTAPFDLILNSYYKNKINMGICMLCEDPDENKGYNIEPLSQQQVNLILYEDNSSIGALVIKKKKPNGKKKEIHSMTQKRNGGTRRQDSEDDFSFMNKIIDENPERISEK